MALPPPHPTTSPHGLLPPQAFVFELCGVLYDDSCWRRWMIQLLARIGLQTHYRAFYQVWEQEHFEAVARGELTYWAAMRRFLTSAGLPRGRVDEACAAGEARRKQWTASICPLPGVKQTLARLGNWGVPMLAVAHASLDKWQAERCVSDLGLSGWLGGRVLATAELGRAGRFEQRFALAAERLECPLDSVAYVGCGQRPLASAAAAGMQTLVFNSDLLRPACETLDTFEQLQYRLRVAGPLRQAG